jgi:hypothetical protein
MKEMEETGNGRSRKWKGRRRRVHGGLSNFSIMLSERVYRAEAAETAEAAEAVAASARGCR